MAMPLSDADIEQIQAAIQAGRKIEAIKRYREATGVGLAEAKSFIEAIEQGLGGNAPVAAPLAEDQLRTIHAALFAGNKIEAIQAVSNFHRRGPLRIQAGRRAA